MVASEHFSPSDKLFYAVNVQINQKLRIFGLNRVADADFRVFFISVRKNGIFKYVLFGDLLLSLHMILIAL